MPTDDGLVDLQTVERVIDHVTRQYRNKLVEAERRNDLILGELRRAQVEITRLRNGKVAVH